jgi:hypothetical protein
MTGPPLYKWPQTGQIVKGTATSSSLQIHQLKSNGQALCGNKPGQGKKMLRLGSASVTCERCNAIHLSH